MVSRPPIDLSATTVGPEVFDLLLGNFNWGRVLATFSSTLYIILDETMFCMTLDGIDPGPISIMTSASCHADFREMGIAVDQSVHVSSHQLRIADRLRLDLRSCHRWSPSPWPGAPDPELVERGLDRLRKSLPAIVSDRGLGGFINPGHIPGRDDHVGRAAWPLIESAREYTSVGTCRIGFDWARRLVGLGHGLTPSGDDFLGGMLIAKHAIGHHDAARRLWAELAMETRMATNIISRTLMAVAARGQGSSGLHRAIDRIMTGRESSDAVSIVSRSGYSSGLDALAGAVTVLESFAGRGRRSTEQGQTGSC